MNPSTIASKVEEAIALAENCVTGPLSVSMRRVLEELLYLRSTYEKYGNYFQVDPACIAMGMRAAKCEYDDNLPNLAPLLYDIAYAIRHGVEST